MSERDSQQLLKHCHMRAHMAMHENGLIKPEEISTLQSRANLLYRPAAIAAVGKLGSPAMLN